VRAGKRCPGFDDLVRELWPTGMLAKNIAVEAQRRGWSVNQRTVINRSSVLGLAPRKGAALDRMAAARDGNTCNRAKPIIDQRWCPILEGLSETGSPV
jgi:hypothetical protein